MSRLTVKELEAPTGQNIELVAGETLDLSAGTVTLPPSISLGKINDFYYNKTSTETTTTGTSYVSVVSVNVPVDTSLYNYFITFHTPVNKSTTTSTSHGVDLAIYIDSTVHSEAGHRMHSIPNSPYMNQSIVAYVTSGHTGGSNLSIGGYIASYNTGTTVSTHDNHPNSGSTIMVWEMKK